MEIKITGTPEEIKELLMDIEALINKDVDVKKVDLSINK